MATFKQCPVQELTGNNSQVFLGSSKGCQAGWQASTGTDGKERWSKEVLDAIETHLSLLEREASRKLAARTDNNYVDGRADSNRSCRTDEEVHACGKGRSFQCLGSEKGPMVELSSQAPLPDGWEQFLDLRTGQVYYIDWNSYKRSYIDPRKVLQLGNYKASFFLDEAWSGRDVQSAVTNSECVTDCSSYVGKSGSGDELEVNSKWTAPLHQEDWELMESRGWLWSGMDANRSEVSAEVYSSVSDESSSSSCEAESEVIMKMTVKGCRQCLSYTMAPESNSWCPHCGDALP